MTKDTFSELQRNIKNIIDIDDAPMKSILDNRDALLQILDESIEKNRSRLLKELEVQNPEEMLQDIRELLGIILSGNQDFYSIRKLALRALRNGTSIYKFALSVSSILDSIKDEITSRVENGKEVLSTIKKFTIVMLLLLADEISQAFLEALREATGMSQALLENYMKSVIGELISRNGS